MAPSTTIILLWLAFGGSHILLSSLKVRPRLVAALGERGFLGFYSLVSFATFSPLVAVYFRHVHEGAEFWSFDLSVLAQWFIYIVMGVAFVLVVAGVVTPSPTSISSGRKGTPAQPRGVHLITRHALFMGIGLFGAVHLLANGYATDVAFFGGFPLFVLLGTWHQDQRKLVTEPESYSAFYAATPLIPFAGRETLRGLKEFSRIALVAGVLLAVVTRIFHEVLFG